jgi:phosphomannomutase
MVLSQDRRPLSEIIRGLNPYQQRDLAIPTTHTATIIKNFAKIFKSGKIDYLDGLTVNYPDWWFNLRPLTPNHYYG